MLSHEEIKTLIIALGCGIGSDDFDIGKLRYGKVVIMSVDAEEHVFVRDAGGVRMTRIGAVHRRAPRALGKDFGRQCRKTPDADLGEVLCFGVDDQRGPVPPDPERHPASARPKRCTRSRPPTAARVRVTASHSVFVHEDGKVRPEARRAISAWRPGRGASPIRLPENAPPRIDLLRELHAIPERASRSGCVAPRSRSWYKSGS